MLNYEVTKGRTRQYLSVLPAEIVIGSTTGSGHTDNAGTCTHAAFLAGKYNDEVERTFGADALKAVLAACVDATGDPFFGARGAELELLEAWATLDRRNDLHQVAELADVHGRDTCDSLGLTRVASGNAVLTLTGDRGEIQPGGGEIELDGDVSGALAWNDRFYITDRWHCHIFDASGVRIASTVDIPSRFGISTAVRISAPVRRGETVAFTYWTLGSSSSPTIQALGAVGVFVLSEESEIVGWAPYSRSAAIEHRRRTM